jgi:hypothetical protein
MIALYVRAKPGRFPVFNPRSIRWWPAALPLAVFPFLMAAFQAPQRPPATEAQIAARKAAQEDHQRLMTLLHMTEMRHGADQNNKESPYFVNYDEARANSYPKLPDPLRLKNGKRVTTAKNWWKLRRPEIVEDFDREIYGRVPKNAPKVTWEVTTTTQGGFGDIPTVTRTLAGHVDNSSYPEIKVDIALKVTTPANAKGPVPVVMQFTGGFPAGLRVPPQSAAPAAPSPPPGPSWQDQVIAKGWGYAVLATGSIQADNGGGLRQGIIGLCGKGEPRKLDDWGALRAWAWGASRALDYFETDKTVDPTHVALEGHSRWGKAALVALAYDQRFWTAYVSSSGEGGAKLHRRNWGELVENIAGAGEFYWMAGNFLKYAGPPLNWGDLPVDSHELIALCAPRPVFIGAGTNAGDGWADPKGMFLAAAAAGPVYKLLGKKGLGTAEFPPVETALVAGDVAFRQHAEGHTDTPNWPAFLAFAGAHMAR